MLIDTHCHVDQFPSPEQAVRDCELQGIRVIAVTNLPSHFALAADRLRTSDLVSAALGMHPLSAVAGIREIAAFKRMAPHVDFIGEIGLDFSRHGASTRSAQERVFEEVLLAVKDRPRFITLHSRGAERAVLDGLRRHRIQAAVFHWFSGTVKILDEILAAGHYISVNPSMTASVSGKRAVAQSPRDRILAESDGPFCKVDGSACTPSNIGLVYTFLSNQWKLPLPDVERCIEANFEAIVRGI